MSGYSRKPFILSLKAILLVIISVPSITAHEPSNIDEPKVVEAFVDGLITPLMRLENSPTGVVAVAKGGTTILSKGYGYKDLDEYIPADADNMLVRVASISKLFTWVAVMQQVERGKLDLDADVNTYLKNFQITDTFPGEPITLRHIMTHRTGFEDVASRHLIPKGEELISRSLAESMKTFQPKRVFAPGSHRAYSNYATGLAGLIVENVSGLKFNAYIKENIFDPLGMEHSTFDEPLPAHLAPNMSGEYNLSGGLFSKAKFERLSNFAPAGGMSSTAPDMLKFGQAIIDTVKLGTHTLLKPETMRQMLDVAYSFDDRIPGLALGFTHRKLGDHTIYGHRGDLRFYHSELAIDLEKNLAFFVAFTNRGGMTIRGIFGQSFYDTFYPGTVIKPTRPSDFSSRAERYVGAYHYWRAGFSTIKKMSLLSPSAEVSASGKNSLLINGEEFIEIGPDLFQKAYGTEKIVFHQDEQGMVSGFTSDEWPFSETFRAPYYLMSWFNLSIAGVAMAGFITSLALSFRNRQTLKISTGVSKVAQYNIISVSALNSIAVITGLLISDSVFAELRHSASTTLLVWQALPLLACIAMAIQLLTTANVWSKTAAFNSSVKLNHTLATICGLAMCYLYYFWNLLIPVTS